MNKPIQITIEGGPATGKTAIAHALKRLLSDFGIKAEVKDAGDDVEDMSNPEFFMERLFSIGEENQGVLIETKLTPRE